MSNIVKRGDFLVFQERDGKVTEFFISTLDFDLNECARPRRNRMIVHGCKGFRIPSGRFYEEGYHYWVDRKATLEERNNFIQWMSDKGHTFNMNTLELCLND